MHMYVYMHLCVCTSSYACMQAIESLTTLESLSLSHNQLEEVSARRIQPLKLLGSLDLSYNFMEKTPDFFVTMPSLIHIQMTGNVSRTPKPEHKVRRRGGWHALLNRRSTGLSTNHITCFIDLDQSDFSISNMSSPLLLTRSTLTSLFGCKSKRSSRYGC